MSSIGTILPYEYVGVFVLSIFLAATLTEAFTTHSAKKIATLAWVAFAAFWANTIEYFAFIHVSAIETLLIGITIPACLYIAHLIHTTSYNFTLSTRAITLMGIIYFPFFAFEPPQQALIELVTIQTEFLLRLAGFDPTVIQNDAGFRNTFVFETGGNRILTRVILACTGIGSIAIVSGLVVASQANAKRKLLAITLATTIIWILNLGRVMFITLAHSYQTFQYFVDQFLWLGVENPLTVSYLIADRIIAQSLSVIALFAIIILLLRIVPEVNDVLNEVIEPLLGERIDFTSIF